MTDVGKRSIPSSTADVVTSRTAAGHGPRLDASEYWYPGGAPTTVDVLNLLRRYRAAEGAMRSRTRASMRMVETDLLALRHLLKAQSQGIPVRQRDLADLLELKPATVTALVDRLVGSGHVERRQHPSDRRAVVLVATPKSEHEVHGTLGAMHRRMIGVVDAMGDHELDAVARFLGRMAEAVDPAAERD